MTRRRGRRRVGAIACGVLVGAVTAAGAVRATPPLDGTGGADVGNFTESTPRERRVVMFSDSVGLGARTAVPSAFPSDWQVIVDGRPAEMIDEMERNFVRPRLASDPDWFGDHVVIAAGYNAPYWDWDEFDRSVDSLVGTLTDAGVKHVHWVTLREVKPEYISAGAWRQVQPYYWYFPMVNARLEAALARNPNLTLVDWKAHADRPGITYDAIHLNSTGAQLYADLIRRSVVAAATRIVDGGTARVRVPGGDGAAAAMINLTTINPRRPGHLVVHRCDDDPPGTSVHNFVRDQVVAHAAIAPLDADGDFCVTSSAATNLAVDATGLLTGDGFTAVTPTRWADTRTTSIVTNRTTLRLDVDDVRDAAGVPGDPRAVAIIVTAAGSLRPGHVTVATCGTRADHSNLNFVPGPATPNLAFVAPDADGEICLTVAATTHLVVDLMGVFDHTTTVTADRALRLYDSRDTGPELTAGAAVEIDVGDVIDDGRSAILNLTGTGAERPGHFTAYPCGAGLPESSTLNLAPGPAVANAAVIEPDADGMICVRPHAPAHLVVDLLGMLGAEVDPITPTRVLDTRS